MAGAASEAALAAARSMTAVPPFRWGLVGPGRIAHKFAEVATRLPDSRLLWVHGRTPARAEAFAAQWGAQVAPALDTLLQPGAVDAVYIATPHSEHAAFATRCLQAGVPVLCEKPLVVDAADAHALVALARERRVFLMEALWSRFLPLYARIGQWLRDGAIGRLHAVHSSFCFQVPFDPDGRLFNPALGGGALLDVGIYNLALSRWAFEQAHGEPPQTLQVQAHGLLAPSGVDQRVHATLRFHRDVTVQFTCAFDTQSANALHLLGSEGAIVVPRLFWQGPEAERWRGREVVERITGTDTINGFEWQVQAAMAAIREGRIECPGMPHAESLALADTLQALRRAVGAETAAR
jgi:predicted dehydrogenase